MIPENAPKVHYSPTEPSGPLGGIGEGTLESAGLDAKDGVHSVAVGYGTMGPGGQRSPDAGSNTSPKSKRDGDVVIDNRSRGRTNSTSTLGSLHSVDSHSPKRKKRTTARSGSITENYVDTGGVKKMVLETTSSSDSEEGRSGGSGESGKQNGAASHTDTDGGEKGKEGGKKKRKKRAGKKKHKVGENEPLLGGDS